MIGLTSNEWKRLRAHGVVTIQDEAITWEDVRLAAVRQIVQEYANFLSSAEMVITGKQGETELNSHVHTHVDHAFLLNCRKVSEFFSNRRDREDDVIAGDYAPGFEPDLPIWFLWKDAVTQQLTHVTYTFEIQPRDMTQVDKVDIYGELQSAWKEFQAKLSDPFRKRFRQEIADKRNSGFRGLDLG